MFVRSAALSLLAALTALALDLSAAPLENRSYPIADLMIPVEDHPMPDIFTMPKVKEPNARPTASPSSRQDRLIKIVTDSVDPQSWADVGERGTIDYDPVGMVLVVNQTSATQERVAAFLKALRHRQEVEVSVEVRLVRLSEEMYQRLFTDYHLDLNKPGVCLDDMQVFLLMEAAEADRRTNVMQAPKITLFDGQTAGVSITDIQYFVTGVESVQREQQVVYVPKNEPFESGFKICLRPVVAADHGVVSLDVKANLVNFDQAQLYPVTNFITPIFEGGAQGQPVPFTQFIQVPQFTKFTADTNVKIADGQTAVVGSWTYTQKGCCECCPVVLKQLPCLRKFMEMCGHDERLHCVMLVTPHILVNTEEEAATVEACPAVKPCETQQTDAEEAKKGTEEKATASDKDMGKKLAPIFEQFRKGVLADVLLKYHEACAAGCIEEARRLANVALSLDPTCFDRR